MDGEPHEIKVISRTDRKVSLRSILHTCIALPSYWWSQVLFAGTGPPQAAGRRLGPGLVVLVLAAGLLFFSRLRLPLLEPDEARYAEIPRQMLVEGRWLVPVLHGQPYYHKPPLLYWLVMGSYRVFGVHDWAARLVPCLSGFLTVLVNYFWGRRILGPRAALAGSLVLCLSARFVYLGRMLTMDSLLCLWVVTALAAATLAMQGNRLRWGWWLISALACGLGLLTKGPVALVLVMVPVLAWQLLDRRTARVRYPAWLTYLAVAGCVAGPWYGLLALRDPVFARDFFWTHNLVRYVNPLDHEEPAWFYLPGLLGGMLPWSLLLVPLPRFLARRSPLGASQRPAALGFCLLACLWCLLFFSASGCKRPGYILPAMPPLALALGCYLDAAWPSGLLHRSRRPGLAWGVCTVGTFAVLLIGIQELLPGYVRRFSLRHSVRPQVELAGDCHLPVRCYPRRWDSVSFYLARNDVQVYSAEQLADLVADLQSRPSTLVFVKSERSLSQLLNALPPSLQFEQRGRSDLATAGLVIRRPAVGASLAWSNP